MNNQYSKELCHSQFQGSELYHHGILGMRWGIRRYQPYGHGGYDPQHDGKNVGEAKSIDSNPDNKKVKEQRRFAKTLKKQARLMKKNNRSITNKSVFDKLAYMGPGQEVPRLKTESFKKMDDYVKQRRALRNKLGSEAYNAKYYPEYYDDKTYNKTKAEIQKQDKKILNELLGKYADMPLRKVSVYGDRTVGQLLSSVLKANSGENPYQSK